VPIAGHALPYGLRDVKLTRLTDDGTTTSGPGIDLPNSQTFTFSETEEYQELRGDDKVVATRGSGPTVEWELSAGGISLEAYVVLAGGTLTTTGVSPNVIKRYVKKETDSRPYFRAEGQAINDNGGDFHCVVYRCKADSSLEGELSDQTFWVTSASGKGYGSVEPANLGTVYEFIHNETAVGIVTIKNEIQMVVTDATGGTFTLTYSGQTTAAIAYNATAAAIQTALETLSNIAPGDVAVVRDVVTGPFTVTFMGTLGNTNVAQLTASGASLTGGGIAVYTVQSGG
jgi:hypothetical protein